MSYDIMVCDPSIVPVHDWHEFMKWYEQLTEVEWDETDSVLEDPDDSSPALKQWFDQIRAVFLPWQGKYCPGEDVVEAEGVLSADYEFGPGYILVSTSWSMAEELYAEGRASAEESGLVFADISDDSTLYHPDGTEIREPSSSTTGDSMEDSVEKNVQNNASDEKSQSIFRRLWKRFFS